MAEGMAEIRVTGLNIFPIKSCKACKTDAVQIDSYGVVGDRRFMLVDGTRRFISQRKTPVLATVTARYDQAEGGGTVLHASAPSMGRDLVVIPVLEGERVEVTVWDDSVMAIDQGEDAAKWFSELLGLGVSYIRLMASAESSGGFHRKVANVPQSLQAKLPRFNIPFTDAAPVSIVSEQSLAELNQRMLSQTGHEAPLNRFRMNIEVSGCSKPYEEDEWLLIRIGAVPFIVYIANEVS